jgi:hypothetical protein
VDPSLERRSRKGRGTKFHEEFGYETIVTESTPEPRSSLVVGEIFSVATVSSELPRITSMGAMSDPDTMYFHQAMKQTDAAHFLAAVEKEFETLLARNIIEIVPAFLVPEEMRVFSAVWSMKRKRKVRTRERYKYSKAQPGRFPDANRKGL